jgi:hypothetical protein
MRREEGDNKHQHGTRCRKEKPDPPEWHPFEHKKNDKGNEYGRNSYHDRNEETVKKYRGKLGGL